MANWRTRRGGGRAWRRPAGRRAQIVILGIAGLLAAYAYLKGRDSSLPAILAGQATVIDGDSISIGGWRVRPEGIDAPEWEQTCAGANGTAWPCGKTAARELGALIRGASLTCRPTGFDQYDRVLAECSLPDGTNVNAWLVRQGWAVAFGRSRLYASAEAEAKAAKHGVWVGTFERPSQWRERQSE